MSKNLKYPRRSHVSFKIPPNILYEEKTTVTVQPITKTTSTEAQATGRIKKNQF